MKHIKISIIIPVYNVEAFLCKCIDSILAQKYVNYEVILVDDGSTDDSPCICDEYEKKYEKIRVIHKENGGSSDARNFGVANATGDYVLFVDADDYVDEDYILSFLKIKDKTSADIVCSPLIYEYMSGKAKAIPKFGIKTVDANHAQAYILRSQYCGVSASAKLFPTEILQKHQFPVGKINEDLMTTFLLFEEAKRITFFDHATYHYVQRENSIMHSAVTVETTKISIQYVKKYIDRAKSKRIRLAGSIRLYGLVSELCFSLDARKNKEDVMHLQREISPYLRDVLRDKESDFKQKIKFLLLGGTYHSFLLFCWMKRKMNSFYEF